MRELVVSLIALVVAVAIAAYASTRMHVDEQDAAHVQATAIYPPPSAGPIWCTTVERDHADALLELIRQDDHALLARTRVDDDLFTACIVFGRSGCAPSNPYCSPEGGI